MLGIVFICVAARYHLIFIRRTTISSIPWKLFNSPTYKLAWKSGENLVKNIEMFLPCNESTKTSCTSVLYIIIYTQSKEHNTQIQILYSGSRRPIGHRCPAYLAHSPAPWAASARVARTRGSRGPRGAGSCSGGRRPPGRAPHPAPACSSGHRSTPGPATRWQTQAGGLPRQPIIFSDVKNIFFGHELFLLNM